MIPKKEHLKQIERFHEIFESVDKKIEENKEDSDFILLQKYFELTSKIWPVIDNYIEEIKDILDRFESKSK